MVYLALASVLFNVILGYMVWNAASKLTVYEQFCEIVLAGLRNVLSDIRAVDIRGSFEADDEVGVVYTGISTMVHTLEEFLPEADENAEA